MGAWGTGVFENDTALDTIAEMSELIENYYKGLIDSEDEHKIMLAGFIYLVTTAEDSTEVIREWIKGEKVQLYQQICEIDFLAEVLRSADVRQYKYKLIGNLYKCLDEVDNWSDDSKVSRKATIQEMIDRIAKEN